MTRKQRGLGRGLDALIGAGARRRESLDLPDGDPDGVDAAASSPVPEPTAEERLERLPLGQLTRGRYQPRRDIQPEALEELADSIRAQGVMQPIVVRPVGDARYEIVAGERRWRAAQLAELDTIPAVIREVSDEVALALALIENIQRENLNPVEEAMALKRLLDEFELTQQQVADAVGKSRAQVANLLRLLSLETEVLTLLERGDLDMGHARALLSLSGAKQRKAAHEVVNRDLTVRDTEALVKRMLSGEPKRAESPAPSPDVARLETRLGELLGAPVKIQHGRGGKGRVTIRYSSLDELDGILEHIR
ncbi:ParB/RepB/Spo0J family partition protein [Billgrantia gudaonensis]|uniref:Probable chromosome-partitioning protein ParB n=1 Tax=Billgrantia gudaonensis TaxID=376427 RepID=A0A1G8PFW4_9GAMM|nr:ParB/RepB/Spo0J family partition protein [Halomonas gudaonensis]SDI90660.1 chromosome segregation DNA-binding protein [Halomonas gudaonensis]